MTAVCGGGPSEIIPGTQQIQQMLATAIAGALVNAEFDWLSEVASGLGYITFDLLDVCVTDPPGYPTITADRLAGYINPLNPQGAVQLREDVTQILQTWLWYQYCKCTTGTTPGAPTPPAAPTGVQTNNPTTTGPEAGTPCYPEVDRGTTITWTSNGFYDTFTGNFFPNPLSNVTWGQISFDTDQPGDFPVTFTVEYHATTTGPVIGTESFTLNAQDVPLGTTKFVFHPPPQAEGWFWHGQRSGTGGGSTSQVSYKAFLYCGGVPPAADSPCCPPDTSLQNMLVQVLQNELLIISLLPARVPNYAAGTAHTGISDGGTITLDTATIAVKVEITALPPNYGQVIGVPDTYIDVGWLTPVNNEGPSGGVRISRLTQTFALPEATSSLDYSLPSGESVTITELQAG